MVFEIDEQTKKHTEELLKKMKKPVKLKVFVTKDHCLICNETIQIVDLLDEMSSKIVVEKCDCDTEIEEAKKYGIDKHPAILIQGENQEFNVRYFGLPGGYEFGALVEDIVDASTGDLGLAMDTIKKLEEIDKPVHIQVFTLTTCPSCPKAVRMTHKFAMVNKNIIADMIEAQEFMDLAIKYQVTGVPRTIINEKVDLVGAAPEEVFLTKVLEALE